MMSDAEKIMRLKRLYRRYFVLALCLIAASVLTAIYGLFIIQSMDWYRIIVMLYAMISLVLYVSFIYFQMRIVHD